jgi:glycosyltransferase involved in cell wall biosynthesis
MKKTKVLIVSTHPALTTGYARIANIVGNYLADQPGLEVVHFGFEKYPGTYLSDRFIDPRIKIISVVDRIDPAKDRFGTTLIKDVVEKEVRPDVVLVYNDVVVTCQMLNNFMDPKKRPFKVVSYLDLVYKWECVEFIRHIDRWSDRVFVFSDIWRRHLLDDFGMRPDKVGVFPHGFDADIFRPLDRPEARRRLNLDPDDYVVLNTNRNSYRKALDITIGGFLRFLADLGSPRHVKLFLNCRLDVTDGYDVPNVIQVECMKLGLDYHRVSNHHIVTMGGNASGLLTDETLNVVYNASDVGLNTCVGEGFGLCNLEGAGLGIPQIVSDVGGLHDIFGSGKMPGCTTVPPAATMYLARGIDSHGGEISIVRPEDVAEALRRTYDDFSNTQKSLRACVLERYHWPTLLNAFVRDLLGAQTPSENDPSPEV